MEAVAMAAVAMAAVAIAAVAIAAAAMAAKAGLKPYWALLVVCSGARRKDQVAILVVDLACWVWLEVWLVGC